MYPKAGSNVECIWVHHLIQTGRAACQRRRIESVAISRNAFRRFPNQQRLSWWWRHYRDLQWALQTFVNGLTETLHCQESEIYFCKVGKMYRVKTCVLTPQGNMNFQYRMGVLWGSRVIVPQAGHSNGLAERAVKTLKYGMRKSTSANNMETRVSRVFCSSIALPFIQLLEYRQLKFYWVDNQDCSLIGLNLMWLPGSTGIKLDRIWDMIQELRIEHFHPTMCCLSVISQPVDILGCQVLSLNKRDHLLISSS